MYEILLSQRLNENTKRLVIKAPLVARHAKPGQFVMLRCGEWGERVPLTIADSNPETGSVTVIFQEIGATTIRLGKLKQGGFIDDVAGPLGQASHLSGFNKVCVVGGGLGCAIAYPQARALRENGTDVTIIAGFRSKNMIILEDEMRKTASELCICTDDGSYGEKGLVTAALKRYIDNGAAFDAVIAIGPVVMMKFVCLTTKPYSLKTLVSLNPIMVDGTGMCGACRVTVGGRMRFACVDGPDFDGHEVDFDELSRRNTTYHNQEQHKCKLTGELSGGQK